MLENLYEIAGTYLQNSNPLVFLAVYFAGVVTSFTPCIYPILPLTIAYFGAQAQKSRKELLALILIYVSGMSVIYAGMGMIAAFTGSLFGKIAVHPITLVVFANICLFFGLAMLDVFDLSFLTASAGIGKKKKGFIGAFITGASAGLVVGPCTTPVLGVLLTYVGSKQNIILGSTLLFIFSFGMGTLLIFVGMFAGLAKKLPKAGGWTEKIKKATGYLMIILAQYFLFKAGTTYF